MGQKVILTCFLINLRFLAKVSPLINFLKIFYSGHLIPTPLLINFCKKILTRTFPNVYNTNFSTQNVSSEIFLQFVLQLNIKILCKNPFPMLLKLPLFSDPAYIQFWPTPTTVFGILPPLPSSTPHPRLFVSQTCFSIITFPENPWYYLNQMIFLK